MRAEALGSCGPSGATMGMWGSGVFAWRRCFGVLVWCDAAAAGSSSSGGCVRDGLSQIRSDLATTGRCVAGSAMAIGWWSGWRGNGSGWCEPRMVGS